MRNKESLPVGIVVERRQSRHPWQDHSWRVVAIVPGTPRTKTWRLLYESKNVARFHAVTLLIELYPSGTAGYQHNLSQRVPCVYVVSHRDDDGRPKPVVATVDAYEVTDYLDSSDNDVEGVPMPDVIAAWLARYIARHHQEKPFKKRERRPHGPRGGGGSGRDG